MCLVGVKCVTSNAVAALYMNLAHIKVGCKCCNCIFHGSHFSSFFMHTTVTLKIQTELLISLFSVHCSSSPVNSRFIVCRSWPSLVISDLSSSAVYQLVNAEFTMRCASLPSELEDRVNGCCERSHSPRYIVLLSAFLARCVCSMYSFHTHHAYIDCLFNLFFPLFFPIFTLYKLHFDNFSFIKRRWWYAMFRR